VCFERSRARQLRSPIPDRTWVVLTPSPRSRHDLVVVVNEALAERFWPGQSAAGDRLQVPRSPCLNCRSAEGHLRIQFHFRFFDEASDD
jgi:hypothetical protein